MELTFIFTLFCILAYLLIWIKFDGKGVMDEGEKMEKLN